MIKIILSFIVTASLIWVLWYMFSKLDRKGRKELAEDIMSAVAISMTAFIILGLIVYIF